MLAETLELKPIAQVPTPTFGRLLTPTQYYDGLIREIGHAKKSVTIQNFLITPKPPTFAIMGALVNAVRQRGIKALVIPDEVTRSSSIDPDKFDGYLDKISRVLCGQSSKATTSYQRKINEMFGWLKDSGVEIVPRNRITRLAKVHPSVGRVHSKVIVIDGSIPEGVGYITTVNKSDTNSSKVDIAGRFNDPDIVQALQEYTQRLVQRKISSDYTQPLKGGKFHLVVDSGRFDRSANLEVYKDLISSARDSLEVITEFLPWGQELELLLEKARSGVTTNLYILPPDNGLYHKVPWRFVSRGPMQRVLSPDSNINVVFIPKCHAKGILVDKENPELARAHISSCNVTELGSLAATAEVGFTTRDPFMIYQFTNFFRNLNNGQISFAA